MKVVTASKSFKDVRMNSVGVIVNESASTVHVYWIGADVIMTYKTGHVALAFSPTDDQGDILVAKHHEMIAANAYEAFKNVRRASQRKSKAEARQRKNGAKLHSPTPQLDLRTPAGSFQHIMMCEDGALTPLNRMNAYAGLTEFVNTFSRRYNVEIYLDGPGAAEIEQMPDDINEALNALRKLGLTKDELVAML
ncbi:hypothetical protein NVP1081O_225 [Vibrio phage 1.081.O._10N.286.52.C2]|nr:hypothetical protein NVP1081O_225 [Vibrio phage 1.081.O._10N.286.52.C2]